MLQALRAHDDRFNATVNKLELNKNATDSILVGHVPNAAENLTDSTSSGDGTTASADTAAAESAQVAQQLSMFSPTSGGTLCTPRLSIRSARAPTGRTGPRTSP